jgi:hypothetical protein
MILSYRPAWAERVRTYTDLAGMIADGFTATTPEYLAAASIWAQNPRPPRIKVGRGALPPTQRYDITVVTVANSTDYTVTLADGTEVTYTSDANATNDEIATGLAAAIDAAQSTHTGTTTGSGGSLQCRVTADAAGNWMSLAVQDVNYLKITQNNSATTVATDLAAINTEDPDWYCLINLFNSELQAAACAAWVESNNKFFVCASSDTEIISVATGSATDLAKDLATSAYERTALIYHPDPSEFADAAWAGNCLPLDPGSETWNFKTLAGVAAYSLTATHKTNLRAKKANFYTTVAGVNVTQDGQASSGEWIDVVRFRDWFTSGLQERIASVLFNAKKVPFTDAGIALIKGEIWAQIADGIAVGGIATDPAPTVTAPRASAVSSLDKADRILPDVSFTFTLAGAIHSVTISGVVSV